MDTQEATGAEMTTDTAIVDLTGTEPITTTAKAEPAKTKVDTSAEVRAYGAAETDEARAAAFAALVDTLKADETITDPKATARSLLQRRSMLAPAQAA